LQDTETYLLTWDLEFLFIKPRKHKLLHQSMLQYIRLREAVSQMGMTVNQVMMRGKIGRKDKIESVTAEMRVPRGIAVMVTQEEEEEMMNLLMEMEMGIVLIRHVDLSVETGAIFLHMEVLLSTGVGAVVQTLRDLLGHPVQGGLEALGDTHT
jgi:hypothetical protein